MPRTKLDNYLRAYRKRSGLSQDEVAYLLGYHSGTKVSRHERSGKLPTLDAALAYRAIFKTSAEQLFAGRSVKVDQAVRNRARCLVRRLSGQGQSLRLDRKLESLGAIRGLGAAPTPAP